MCNECSYNARLGPLRPEIKESIQKEQQKKMEELAQRLKGGLQERLNREKERREQQKSVQPPPRYDGVFLEGVEWLSSLTGKTIPADLRNKNENI